MVYIQKGTRQITVHVVKCEKHQKIVKIVRTEMATSPSTGTSTSPSTSTSTDTHPITESVSKIEIKIG